MSDPENKPARQAVVKDTVLQQMTVTMAKEEVLLSMFRRFDGANPKHQDKLEEAFKKKYGRTMRKGGAREVRAWYLEGEPGHGKTTAHREAAKEFAQLMGLRFVDEPSLAQIKRGLVDENCMVFTTLTVAGATSKHEVGGLMAKIRVGKDGEEATEMMGHLPDWRLAATMMGAYGYTLFDDFVTAAHPVQNACLDLLLGGSAGDLNMSLKDVASSDVKFKDGQVVIEFNEEKANQIEDMNPGSHQRGVSTVHIGLAGNRGTRDGNKTFPLTTATITRVQRADVFDTVDDFVARANMKYTDEIGSAYYESFIKSNPELFTAISKPVDGITPSMPCPRTHDALMDTIGYEVHMHGGFQVLSNDEETRNKFLDRIEMLAGTHIGRQISAINKQTGKEEVLSPSVSVSGYYTELLLGAIPKAQDIIDRNEVDIQFIQDKLQGSNTSSGQNFAYQFSSALATLAGQKVADHVKTYLAANPKHSITDLQDPDCDVSMKIRETMNHFGNGISFLKAPLVSYGIDKLLTKLSSQVPEMFNGDGAYKIMKTECFTPVLYGLFKNPSKFPDQLAEMKDTIVSSITQYGSLINDGKNQMITNTLAERRAKALDVAKQMSL